MITDSDTLFMPIDSEAKRDERLSKYLFNSSSKLSSDYYLHQILDFGTWTELNFLPCQTNNILEPDLLKKISQVHNWLLNNSIIEHNSSKYFFEDVCAKRNGECIIDGIDLLEEEFYDRWLHNAMDRKERYFEEASLMTKTNKNEEEQVSYQPDKDFRFYIKISRGKIGFTDLTYNLGKDFHINTLNESNNRKTPGSARILKLRYNLKSDFENADEAVRKWERKFIQLVQSLVDPSKEITDLDFTIKESCRNKNQPFQISFASSQSLDIEMAANIVLDSYFIAGTFIMIMIFAILIMSVNSDCITSPGVILPLAGISSAIFGISSSFGLMSYLDYPGCNLIFVIPFLVVGIGIDDMFIIYSSFLFCSKQLKAANSVSDPKDKKRSCLI